MGYGNQPPPVGAPVAPPELIGASLYLGLVSVVFFLGHGSYLIALLVGGARFDLPGTIGLLVSIAGFVASLWLLSLRRWAWALAIADSLVEVVRRLYFIVEDLVPSVVHPGVSGRGHTLAAVGEALVLLVLLLVLAYISGPDTRRLLAARRAYRLAQLEGSAE